MPYKNKYATSSAELRTQIDDVAAMKMKMLVEEFGKWIKENNTKLLQLEFQKKIRDSNSTEMQILAEEFGKWIKENPPEDNNSIQNEGKGAYTIRAVAEKIDLQAEGCGSKVLFCEWIQEDNPQDDIMNKKRFFINVCFQESDTKDAIIKVLYNDWRKENNLKYDSEKIPFGEWLDEWLQTDNSNSINIRAMLVNKWIDEWLQKDNLKDDEWLDEWLQKDNLKDDEWLQTDNSNSINIRAMLVNKWIDEWLQKDNLKGDATKMSLEDKIIVYHLIERIFSASYDEWLERLQKNNLKDDSGIRYEKIIDLQEGYDSNENIEPVRAVGGDVRAIDFDFVDRI